MNNGGALGNTAYTAGLIPAAIGCTFATVQSRVIFEDARNVDLTRAGYLHRRNKSRSSIYPNSSFAFMFGRP